MTDVERAINAELEKWLKTIEYRARAILEEEIRKQVYDKYQPKQYVRTNQLQDKVKTAIKDGALYVYINTGDMDYQSVFQKSKGKSKRKEDVTSKVPFWINYGHNSNYANRFMFFQYPTRGFIETALARIKSELGVEVTIMKEGF